MTLNNKKVVAIVLGGGRGTRLYPLTMDRSKPAVPFAGKYRLVDIPISNCINSNIRQIYVLTQFNSASLHNHIASTYNFDAFSGGFVEILAAEQTYTSETWYQGTADAVRKNLKHFRDQNADYYVILSGDQLYRMDFNKMLQRHIESNAVLTIAGKPISRPEATGLGIMGCDEKGMITKFYEKPSPDADITDYIIPESTLKDQLGLKRTEKNEYIASMGIYIFNAAEMEQALNNDKTDFGKEIIPDIIKTKPVSSYLFDGYWEDIGTVKAFYEANLNLASDKPSFNFYDEEMPIYTHRRHLQQQRQTSVLSPMLLHLKVPSSQTLPSSTQSSVSEPLLKPVLPLMAYTAWVLPDMKATKKRQTMQRMEFLTLVSEEPPSSREPSSTRMPESDLIAVSVSTTSRELKVTSRCTRFMMESSSSTRTPSSLMEL